LLLIEYFIPDIANYANSYLAADDSILASCPLHLVAAPIYFSHTRGECRSAKRAAADSGIRRWLTWRFHRAGDGDW
jgi:hypothetical protein